VVDVYRRPFRLNLPPLKAIREKCVQDCCNGYTEEVDNCLVPYCELYPYRFGKIPEDKKNISLPKVIRAKCIECSGGIISEVDKCPITDCPLYHLRFGKNKKKENNPKGNPNPKALKQYRESKLKATV